MDINQLLHDQSSDILSDAEAAIARARLAHYEKSGTEHTHQRLKALFTLASRAVKMLRFKGVDVLSTATEGGRERTLVYDRVGDFRRAAETLRSLGCPSARAVTRVDPSRVVDVSISLGADCAGAFGPGASREP